MILPLQYVHSQNIWEFAGEPPLLSGLDGQISTFQILLEAFKYDLLFNIWISLRMLGDHTKSMTVSITRGLPVEFGTSATDKDMLCASLTM